MVLVLPGENTILSRAGSGQPLSIDAKEKHTAQACGTIPKILMAHESIYLEPSVISYYAARPSQWKADAVHVTTAAVREIDYLVTWNCSYIANARFIRELPRINASMDVATPTICTPEELREE
jgi:hypothetical protein